MVRRASAASAAAASSATAPRVRRDTRTKQATAVSRKALAALVLQRPASGKSTKELSANLAVVRKHLGRPCPHFGKKGVVQLAAQEDQGSGMEAPPKFNKYAGWVEWQNAIFLWVNASGGSFVNNFVQGGRQVNWYVGGARPTEQSPIVRRLLGTSKRQGGDVPTEVILFVRPKSTEPYISCGRVGYVAHNAGKKGFEFTWRLRDFQALSKSLAFNEILESQRPSRGRRSAAAAVVKAKWA